jgi:hypothetical protein
VIKSAEQKIGEQPFFDTDIDKLLIVGGSQGRKQVDAYSEGLFCETLDLIPSRPQAFISYSNPKGNADTYTKSAKQRVMRTLKEELVHIREWKSQEGLIKALGGWIRFYNEEYLHSSLGYKSPTTFASPTSCEKEWEGGRDMSASYGLTNGEQYRALFFPSYSS